MNKSQKIFFLFVAASLLVILVLATLSYLKNLDRIIFYYGIGCPHCANVEDFMKKNNVESKFNISKKEVYYSKTNSLELKKIARKCGLDINNIGVPLVYASGKCYIGEEEIIKFLELKIKSFEGK